MKKLLFLIVLVTASVSQAETRILYCDGGHEAFTAEFPRLPYFSLKNAQVTGAFTHTNFICEPSSTFEGLKCTGFWNDISSMPIEVSFTTVFQTQIYFKSLSTNEIKSWPCKFEYIQ
jgi:hypothetical protein